MGGAPGQADGTPGAKVSPERIWVWEKWASVHTPGSSPCGRCCHWECRWIWGHSTQPSSAVLQEQAAWASVHSHHTAATLMHTYTETHVHWLAHRCTDTHTHLLTGVHKHTHTLRIH